MRHTSIISALLFIAGILTMLLQLWFSLWPAEIFFKIIATLAAFFVISLVVGFVNKEMRDIRRLNNGDDNP